FPRNVVYAGIILFSIVGSYAIRNSVFDVGVVLVFGLLGFGMEKVDIPLPPMILGLILGPMIEENLRVGLIKTDGSFLPFLSRPISFVMFMIVVVMFFWDPIKKIIVQRSKAGKGGKDNE
ncbi:MAG: tripartite tricarboxylate transporter permease, partial [Spirochaetia bacterium]|nr:tripartite tricarboxylate transporter permease [Spirochaetia bacterium]